MTDRRMNRRRPPRWNIWRPCRSSCRTRRSSPQQRRSGGQADDRQCRRQVGCEAAADTQGQTVQDSRKLRDQVAGRLESREMDDSMLAAMSDFAVEMRAIRHDIHRHPELGFNELRTAALVAERLRAWGITVHERIGKNGLGG